MEEIKIISELSFLELVDFGSKDFQLFKAERFQVNWFLFSRRSKDASHYPKWNITKQHY